MTLLEATRLVPAPHYFEDLPIVRDHFLTDISWPTAMLLETSSWCNLRCPMCPRTINLSPSGTDYGNMHISILDRLDHLFDHIQTIGLAWIGEPLINKDLPEIIRTLKKRGIQVQVTSNGMLLKPKMARELIEAGLDMLSVSIDAVEPNLYKEIRVGGKIDIVKRNIRNFNALKEELGGHTLTQLAFVAMPNNIQEAPRILDLAKELSVPIVNIGPMDDFVVDGLATPDTGALGPRKVASTYINEARAKAEEHGIILGYTSPHRLSYEIGEVPERDDFSFRTNYTPQEVQDLGLRKACALPWVQTVVADNGDVHPCCISQRTLGNVTEETFEAIWHGDTYRDFRSRLLSTNPPEECWGCRRAHWVKPRPVEALKDEIEVLGPEFHGQGWYEAYRTASGKPYRQLGTNTTFFLKYNRQPYLELELGSISGAVIEYDLLINNAVVARRTVSKEWEAVVVPMPAISGNTVKVTIRRKYDDRHMVLFRGALCTADVARAKWLKYGPLLNPVRNIVNWARRRTLKTAKHVRVPDFA